MVLQGLLRAHSLPQRPRDERVRADEDKERQHEQKEGQQQVVAFLVVGEQRWPNVSALLVACVSGG